jgi:hypothetical protein
MVIHTCKERSCPSRIQDRSRLVSTTMLRRRSLQNILPKLEERLTEIANQMRFYSLAKDEESAKEINEMK